jgi:hypothetical protein
MDFVDPEFLTSVRLPSQYSTLDVLENVAALTRDFPFVQQLHMHCEDEVLGSGFIKPALSRFAGLQHLRLFPKRGSGSLNWPVIPAINLQSFEGPHYVLPSILEQSKTLRYVALFGNRWEGTCDLIDIRRDLLLLQSSGSNLDSLRLHIFPTAAITHDITALFPTLRSLSFCLPLEARHDVDPMYALTEEVSFSHRVKYFAASRAFLQAFYPSVLNMVVPPSLVCLEVYMVFTSVEQGFIAIETLAKKHASLRHICLLFPRDFWITWEGSPPTRSTANRYREPGIAQGTLSSGYLMPSN